MKRLELLKMAKVVEMAAIVGKRSGAMQISVIEIDQEFNSDDSDIWMKINARELMKNERNVGSALLGGCCVGL